MIRKKIAALASAALVAAGVLVGVAAPAQAADWGGDGNPGVSCSGGYTVASAPIYGSRGHLNGVEIGQLELRWAWSCGGNWSRVVLYGGMYSDQVTIEQSIYSEGRSAGADDFVYVPSSGTSAWSPYLHLANSSSTACVTATVSSNFGTLNFHTNGASFCV